MRLPDYFAEFPQQIPVVREICESWRGTPFRQCSYVKGTHGGVDCGGFVGSVFAEAGVIPATIALPPYDLNHAEHCADSVLREWFEQPAVRARVRRLDVAEPSQPFDLVFPKVGQTEHHLALQYFGEIYHVVRPSGVCVQTIAGLALHRVTLSPWRYRLLISAAIP